MHLPFQAVSCQLAWEKIIGARSVYFSFQQVKRLWKLSSSDFQIGWDCRFRWRNLFNIFRVIPLLLLLCVSLPRLRRKHRWRDTCSLAASSLLSIIYLLVCSYLFTFRSIHKKLNTEVLDRGWFCRWPHSQNLIVRWTGFRLTYPKFCQTYVRTYVPGISTNKIMGDEHSFRQKSKMSNLHVVRDAIAMDFANFTELV